MSSFDNDPPERTGASASGELADPRPSRKAKPVAPPKPLTEELAAPEPPRADASPSAAEGHPGSHPKHAIERPRREHEAAQAETRDAHAELTLARKALAHAERAEGAALQTWLDLQPKVDPDQLLRDFANNATTQRATNKAAGLPVEGVKVPTHGNSALDIAAAQRARPSAQMPTAPLRSAVQRRHV